MEFFLTVAMVFFDDVFSAERNQNMKVLGIKPGGIINFLSNEAPRQIMQRLQIPHCLPWGASFLRCGTDIKYKTGQYDCFCEGFLGKAKPLIHLNSVRYFR